MPDDYPAMKQHHVNRPALVVEFVVGARGQPRRRHVRLVRDPNLALLLRLKGAGYRSQRQVVKMVTVTLLLTEPVPFSTSISGSRKAFINFSR
jgi:hypothetical protein